MDTVSPADQDALQLSVVDGTKQEGYEQLQGSDVYLADIVVVSGADVNDEFDKVANEAVLALDTGVNADLISSGSSGAYFIRDRQKVITVLVIDVCLVCVIHHYVKIRCLHKYL